MEADLKNMPTDPSLFKEFVLALVEKYEEKIHYLEEKLRVFQNELFGRKTERRAVSHPEQLLLFEDVDKQEAAPPPTITIATHVRKKRGRKPLPKDLPRVEIIHDLDKDQKKCACGADLSCIGQDVSEKLDYIPAKLRVERHIRLKYACKVCEGVEGDGATVKTAPAPQQLIPKSNASEGLLAHVAVSKFSDGLPLYRQQNIFKRHGIEIPRATLANWMVRAARACSSLADLLQAEILSGPLINIDESPLQVLNEPGRANTTKSYMWVFRGGQPDRPTLFYLYQPTRSGKTALEFLDSYQGYIQSDDFAGYNHLDKRPGIIHLGCWAHVRRKIIKVVQVRKKHRSKRVNPKGLADEALGYIDKMYMIEKQARHLDPEQIYRLRQEKTKPLLWEFKQWLMAKKDLTPPKGMLGQAINYALANWDKLIVFLQDGLLRPDNNLVENAIRPFVLGRKKLAVCRQPRRRQGQCFFFQSD